MTSTRIRALLAGAVVLALFGFAYFRAYAAPRAKVVGDIEALRTEVGQFEEALRAYRGVGERLRAVADTTLGATPAQIEHRFRSSLGEIARHCGLEEVVPDSGRPRGAVNPAANASPRIGGDFGRMLKDRPDFYVVEGSLTGVGTLEAALRALATVQSQAWAHRVGSVSIKPADASRERFELRIGSISTMLMPDLVEADAEAPGWTVLDDGAARRWSAITAKNVFRVPAEPAPESDPEPEPAPEPEPDPGPGYAQWRLTGLPGGRTGELAGLVNASTGERVFLEVGQSVLDAQLAEVRRFSAVFEIAGARYEVQIGQTLAERREVP